MRRSGAGESWAHNNGKRAWCCARDTCCLAVDPSHLIPDRQTDRQTETDWQIAWRNQLKLQTQLGFWCRLLEGKVSPSDVPIDTTMSAMLLVQQLLSTGDPCECSFLKQFVRVKKLRMDIPGCHVLHIRCYLMWQSRLYIAPTLLRCLLGFLVTIASDSICMRNSKEATMCHFEDSWREGVRIRSLGAQGQREPEHEIASQDSTEDTKYVVHDSPIERGAQVGARAHWRRYQSKVYLSHLSLTSALAKMSRFNFQKPVPPRGPEETHDFAKASGTEFRIA